MFRELVPEYVLTLFHACYPFIEFACGFLFCDFKNLPKISHSNMPPTLTCGSSRATSMFLPSVHEPLECFPYSCDIFSCLGFLLHNSLVRLYSNMVLQIFCTLLYYLLDHPLHNCYFSCLLIGFFLQCFNMLHVSLLLCPHLVYLLI
jgi:hypothetical protein